MKPWISIVLLGFIFGCGDDTTTKPACPAGLAGGPALNPGTYLLVAHGLGEDWMAAGLSTFPPVAVEQRGLTGRSPNDLDVIGDRLVILSSEDNLLQIIDLRTGDPVGCIDTGAGSNPWAFTVDPDDATRGWVTTFLSGELLELDLDELRVRRRVEVGPGLEGLLISGNHVAVTITGFDGDSGSFGAGSVRFFDRDTLEETARHAVPPNAQVLLGAPDGTIHVVCTGNFGFGEPPVWGQIARLEGDGSAVRDTLVLGGTPAQAAMGAGSRVYLAGYFGGLMSYDASTFTALRDETDPIDDATGYTAVTVSPAGVVAVNFELDAARVFDPDTGALLGEVVTGDGPAAVAWVTLDPN